MITPRICVSRHELKPWTGPLPPLTPPTVRLPVVYPRPKTRGDCLDGGVNAQRPCPWVSCRYNLLVNVNDETGAVEELASSPEELTHTCALDVAEITDLTGRQVILRSLEPFFGVHRERIRQLDGEREFWSARDLELRAIRGLLEGLALGGFSETEIEKKFAEYLVRRDEKEKPHVFEQD